MQRPFLDARLDRRRREPVLCRHRPGRRLRVAQPPARRLHRCGLARNPGHADKTGACGAVLPCRDRLLLPMRHRTALFTLSVAALLLGACARKPPYTVYVSNEASGDLTVIDPVKLESTTIPIGKRARGIHVTPDGKYIFVALSGSPLAPPGVDESTLPPPDKSADGIGVFDVAQNKMLRKVPGGSDPEQFAVGKDGLLYVSNEDAQGLSFVDPVKGVVLKTIPTGQEPEGVTLTQDGKW